MLMRLELRFGRIMALSGRVGAPVAGEPGGDTMVGNTQQCYSPGGACAPDKATRACYAQGSRVSGDGESDDSERERATAGMRAGAGVEWVRRCGGRASAQFQTGPRAATVIHTYGRYSGGSRGVCGGAAKGGGATGPRSYFFLMMKDSERLWDEITA